jgi:hypothetical protein
VAAGSDSARDAPGSEIVRLPIERLGPDRFAVRAVGDPMDGGDRPVRDGAWLKLTADTYGNGIVSLDPRANDCLDDPDWSVSLHGA